MTVHDWTVICLAVTAIANTANLILLVALITRDA